MLQKFHITLCAIIAGLLSVLFSPYTAVANDGKESPCDDIRLLNKASQEWCRSQGWGGRHQGPLGADEGQKSIEIPWGRR